MVENDDHGRINPPSFCSKEDNVMVENVDQTRINQQDKLNLTDKSKRRDKRSKIPKSMTFCCDFFTSRLCSRIATVWISFNFFFNLEGLACTSKQMSLSRKKLVIHKRNDSVLLFLKISTLLVLVLNFYILARSSRCTFT